MRAGYPRIGTRRPKQCQHSGGLRSYAYHAQQSGEDVRAL